MDKHPTIIVGEVCAQKVGDNTVDIVYDNNLWKAWTRGRNLTVDSLCLISGWEEHRPSLQILLSRVKAEWGW